jgi:hypothetical protein
MTEEQPTNPQGDPLTIKFWLLWLAQQGIAIIVLVGTTVALGYYLYKVLPERDAQWAKVIETKDQEISKMLKERDERFLEYRVKAEERAAKAITDLATQTAKIVAETAAQKDKDIDRAVNLLTSRINDIQKSTERTAAKVDAQLAPTP